MLRKIFLVLFAGFFYFSESGISAVNLRKLASFDSSKIFKNTIHSSHDNTALFFDQGRKILAGQDFLFSETYKFYMINNPATSEKETKTLFEIKEFEELAFPLKDFCKKLIEENKKYACDVTKQSYDSGMINKPTLRYFNREQGLAATSIEVYAPTGDSGRNVIMTYWDVQKNEIAGITILPGNLGSFGLSYINEGDFTNESVLWYADIDGHLFRLDYTTREATENKACGNQLSKIYSEQLAQMEDEKKRTGKNLIRMPLLRLTPFVSSDEKYVLLFDYSDIDDGDPVNKIGFAYYCEIATGKMEKFPGQHTVYAATMSLPGKIIYYTNQKGEYFSLDLNTKKLTQVLKGRNMGDRMSIFGESAIVYDDDFAWVDARKLSNLRQVKAYSMISMEKTKNEYANRVIVNPQSSTLLFAVYQRKDEMQSGQVKFFLYKMSLK